MKHKFHNVEFSLNERKSIESYSAGREWTIEDVLQSSIELGVKVSFSYDEYHDCALLSLTPKIEEHPFYGYVVSVRHQDISKLFIVVMWLTAEGWDQLESPKSSNGRFAW